MTRKLHGANVVRLPTAAPRQVKQNCNRWGRAARAALKEAQPWPGEYIHHQQRAALQKAETLIDVKRTPALVLALAIFAELDKDTRLRVIGRMAAGGGSPSVRQAIALTGTVGMTVGERFDLDWALEHLREQGRGSD